VLPACATNGDGEVAAVVGDKSGDPFVQEVGDVLLHVLDIWVLLQPFLNLGVFACQGAKVRFVVGVGEDADIENVVCINRNAAFEGEGFKDEGECVLGGINGVFDPGLELRRAQQAAVDDGAAEVMYFCEKAAFFFDGFFEDEAWVFRVDAGFFG